MRPSQARQPPCLTRVNRARSHSPRSHPEWQEQLPLGDLIRLMAHVVMFAVLSLAAATIFIALVIESAFWVTH